MDAGGSAPTRCVLVEGMEEGRGAERLRVVLDPAPNEVGEE